MEITRQKRFFNVDIPGSEKVVNSAMNEDHLKTTDVAYPAEYLTIVFV